MDQLGYWLIGLRIDFDWLIDLGYAVYQRYCDQQADPDPLLPQGRLQEQEEEEGKYLNSILFIKL